MQKAAETPFVILASGSPRRRELLAGLGFSYEVLAPDVDETCVGMPAQRVTEIAGRKARAVAARRAAGVIVAADTLVAVDGNVLGKPRDAADAHRMLTLLSGRAHEVFTGVCLLDAASGRQNCWAECTQVFFRTLCETEIDAYIATGEPMDKAGAYAIQGGAAAFIEKIAGSRTNVIGFPTEAFLRAYRQFVTETDRTSDI